MSVTRFVLIHINFIAMLKLIRCLEEEKIILNKIFNVIFLCFFNALLYEIIYM